MAKPPGRCDHHPGQPRPAPHDHHPGPWLPAALMLGAEGAQARDETVRITAPVRMMRPDEIPAAAPSLIHLPTRPQPRRRDPGMLGARPSINAPAATSTHLARKPEYVRQRRLPSHHPPRR